jgi:hypothetical protein
MERWGMGDGARAEVLRNNWADGRRRVKSGWLLRAASSSKRRCAVRGGNADGDGNSVVGLVFGAWAWSPSPESSVSSPPVVSLHLLAVRTHIHMPAVA